MPISEKNANKLRGYISAHVDAQKQLAKATTPEEVNTALPIAQKAKGSLFCFIRGITRKDHGKN